MYQSRMLINGKDVASHSGKVDIIYNPANQEPVATVSVGSRQDASYALEAAKQGISHLVWNIQSEESRAPARCSLFSS